MAGLKGTRFEDFIIAAKKRAEDAIEQHKPRLTTLENPCAMLQFVDATMNLAAIRTNATACVQAADLSARSGTLTQHTQFLIQGTKQILFVTGKEGQRRQQSRDGDQHNTPSQVATRLRQ